MELKIRIEEREKRSQKKELGGLKRSDGELTLGSRGLYISILYTKSTTQSNSQTPVLLT